jgi:hypothetical protein
MTTQPSQESPGGMVVIFIDRPPAVDPTSAEYSVSFGAITATGAVLLGRVEGLDALRRVLRKLDLTGPEVETACLVLTERPHYEVPGVLLTQTLIRGLGF